MSEQKNEKKVAQHPDRRELEKNIQYLLEHVNDDEAVYAAWIVLNRAYNRQ